MFERFTEDARRALFFARAETAQRQGDSITPEDLLAGILWALPNAIGYLGSDSSTTITRMERADDFFSRVAEDQAWNAHASKEIRFSEAAKLVLMRAGEEADALRHKPIRPEHLILGVLRDETSEASRTLNRAGVTLRQARRILAEEP